MSDDIREDVEIDETVERHDTGASITLRMKRGTSTRDQETVEVKAKGKTVEEATEQMDDLRDYAFGLGEEARDYSPGAEGSE